MIQAEQITKKLGGTQRQTDSKVISKTSFILHGPQRKRKNWEGTQQGDLIIYMKRQEGDTQADRQIEDRHTDNLMISSAPFYFFLTKGG
jgi:hypothetical protein